MLIKFLFWYHFLRNKLYLFVASFFLKSIGKGTSIDFPVKIKYPHNVSIGDDVAINSFVHIWGAGTVKIGNRVMIASNSVITTLSHNPDEKSMRFSIPICLPIEIKDDVWIGANAIILPGVIIGEGAVVGAGSLVNKNVEPFSIVVGVPAKKIRMRNTFYDKTI